MQQHAYARSQAYYYSITSSAPASSDGHAREKGCRPILVPRSAWLQAQSGSAPPHQPTPSDRMRRSGVRIRPVLRCWQRDQHSLLRRYAPPQKPSCIHRAADRTFSSGEINSWFWLVVASNLGAENGIEAKLVAPSEIGDQRDVGIGNCRQQEIIGQASKPGLYVRSRIQLMPGKV